MSDHDYLLHGANALKDALQYVAPEASETGIRYSSASMRRFLDLTCATLSELAVDQPVIHLIESGYERPNIDQRFRVKQYVEEFLRADRELMIRSGMEPRMVNYLFRDGAAIIKELSRDHRQGRLHLKARLDDMRALACEGRDPVLASKKTIALPLIGRAVQVIGGAAVVVTNALHMGQLGDATGSLSQAFGGYVVGKGLDG